MCVNAEKGMVFPLASEEGGKGNSHVFLEFCFNFYNMNEYM